MSREDDMLAGLREVFRDELADQLALLERAAVVLERPDAADAERRAASAEVYRAAHSLKGAARAVAYPALERFCHVLESHLGPARHGTAPSDQVARLAGVAIAVLETSSRGLANGGTLDEFALAAGERALADRTPGRTAVQTAPIVEAPKPIVSAVVAVAEDPAPAITTLPVGEESVRVSVTRLGALMTLAEDLLAITGREGSADPLAGLARVLIEARDDLRRVARTARVRAAAEPDPTADEIVRGIERALAGVHTAASVVETQQARDAAGWRAVASGASGVVAEARNLRVLPFARLAPALERAALDAAATLERRVVFRLEGGAVELDRRVLDGLREPLLHLIRNAVDHGIESLDERAARGKPPDGALVVTATLAGRDARIEVRDDGRGIDVAAVRKAARTRGFELAAEAPDRDALALLFEPGFTTRTDVSALSGRGVGLDIVRQRVAQLHGRVELVSRVGAGATFVLTVPVDLSVMRGLLVRVRDGHAVFASTAVARLARVAPTELRVLEGRMYLDDLGGGLVPLADLDETLGLPAQGARDGAEVRRPCVVLAVGDRRVAFWVDALVEEREVVVKSLGSRVRRLAFVAGAVVLADGEVAPLLDAADLARLARPALSDAVSKTAVRRRRILVADDSVTTRQLERTLLEAAGYEVTVAVDGEQAWERLAEDVVFDAVVSDLEMPRLDGFQLLARIRGAPRTARLPVVLITALAGDADRQRALDLGASAYVVKSTFDQDALLETLEQLI